VVVLISTLAFVNQLGSALINPAYVPMSKDLGITVQQASYATTTYVLLTAITPMLFVPFSNVFGRRPLYLVFTAIACASSAGSGAAPTYAGVITGRGNLNTSVFSNNSVQWNWWISPCRYWCCNDL
jgi:MFS family permease